MGSSQSYPGLTEDLIEDYTMLTYLSAGEILHLMKKFYSIDPAKIDADFHHRFPMEDILRRFPVLENNPFQDRLFAVFSSKGDRRFSFEDMVDLFSVMSPECPDDVKAAWAFRVFDIDEDNQISHRDISNILDRITWDQANPRNRIDEKTKRKISEIILEEVNLDGSGSICMNEFKILISKIPDFKTSFYFRL